MNFINFVTFGRNYLLAAAARAARLIDGAKEPARTTRASRPKQAKSYNGSFFVEGTAGQVILMSALDGKRTLACFAADLIGANRLHPADRVLGRTR